MITAFFIATSLCFDSFASAIGLGLKSKKEILKTALMAALIFAFFQTAMPVAGFLLGNSFKVYVSHFDHWIAFFLLSAVGIKFIKESFSPEKEVWEHIDWRLLCLLGFATSIDAFVVGVTLVFIEIELMLTFVLIGLITFSVVIFGIVLAGQLSTFVKSKKIGIVGGVVLILIGVRILLTHLFLS